MRQKKAEDAEPTKEFVIQLAQLWVVAQCRCVPTKMYHSESHLDCFSVDPWLVDEFKNCAEKFSKKLTQPDKDDQQTSVPELRINSMESLQIEVDSLCSTARRTCHSTRRF